MYRRQNVMTYPPCKGSVYFTEKGITSVHFLYFGKVYFIQVYTVESIRIVGNVKIQDQGP